MLTVRRAETLGLVQRGDATLRCHFAFGSYDGETHDGRLRVANLGALPPDGRLHLGPERETDILTWVASGSVTTAIGRLRHQTIAPGGLHAALTGSGYDSLEWRAEPEGASFFQLWFLQDQEQEGGPEQESRAAFAALEDGGFRVLASGFPEDDPEERDFIEDGSPIVLRSAARLLHAAIARGEGASYRTMPGRTLYLIVISGTVTVGEETLQTADAARIEGETEIVIMAREDAVLLLSDTALS